MTEIETDVARMTRPQREARLVGLEAASRALLAQAVAEQVYAADRELAGIVVLFSGGHDSTVLAHLFRDVATHAGHANTGIGIEATRQFVRDTCAAWRLPLLERSAPHERDRYRELVLASGFPGPGHHFKMFQRLKERALEQIRNEVIAGQPRRRRVVFLAGRRRAESARRATVPEVERKGSVVWVSPLVHWSKLDLNTYRLVYADVPRNEVADLIHMSGECLCGCYAKQDERAEVASWFPEAFTEVAELEAILAGPEYAHIAPYARRWGWGWDAEHINASRRKSRRVGQLCSSCEAPEVVA